MARLRISGGKRLLLVKPRKRIRDLESNASIPPKSIMVGRRLEIAGCRYLGLGYDVQISFVRYTGRTFPSSSFPVNLTTRITAFIFCVDVKNV